MERSQPGRDFSGSSMLVDSNGSDLPDKAVILNAGSREYIVETKYVKSVFVDIICDQDATVDIYPLPDEADPSVVGAPGTQLVVTGGSAEI